MSLFVSIKNNALGLALFAFFTAGIVAITQLSTKEKISQNQTTFAINNLSQLVDLDSIDNQLLEAQYDLRQITGLQQIELLNLSNDFTFYLGEKDGEIVSIILPLVAPEGYTGAIDMLVAINRLGQLLGVRVINHKETPGLGDKIDLKKDDWILSFNGKTLDNPSLPKWKVDKDGGDFDSFTGATITPRAVVAAAKDSLHFFELNQAMLMQHPVAANKVIK